MFAGPPRCRVYLKQITYSLSGNAPTESAWVCLGAPEP